MASVFDDILSAGIRRGQVPARTKAARDWYRDKAMNTRNNAIYPSNIIADVPNKRDRPLPGRMYHFRYDPKHKLTLPYYDTFPLIFMVDVAPKGFYGTNVHYLPPRLRARLMDALYDLRSDNRFDLNTEIRLSYEILKSASKYKYFKPTFKRYLSQHVRSRFVEIAPAEWDIALFLHTARFEKASKQKVYSDSARKIG